MASQTTPRAILVGTNDVSSRESVVETQLLGSLIPHIMGYAPKGSTDPKILNGAGMITRHGSDSLNPLSDYGTHATVAATVASGAGATMCFQRIKPADAADPATITLSLEIVTNSWDTPSRDSNGSIIYSDGVAVAEDPGTALTTGYSCRWLVGSLESPYTLGSQSTTVGALAGTGGASTIYPMIEIPVSYFGKDGNYQGVRIWAPEEGGSDGLDTDVVDRIGALLYRIQMISKNESTGKISPVPTIGKDLSVDFSVLERIIDKETGVSYSVDDAIKPYYDGSNLSSPYDAQFDDMYIYRDNWATVSQMIFDLESVSDAMVESVDLVNLISFKTTSGIEYYNVQSLGPSGGGKSLTASTDLFASGGTDGTMSNEALDGEVAEILENFSNQPYEFEDMARYPHNLYIDSGFSVATKKLFGVPGGIRKDMIAIVGLQTAGSDVLSKAEASSLAASIGTALRSFPESDLYGTSTCRSFLVSGGGVKKTYGYGKTTLPMSLDLADMMLKFAAGRNWKSSYSIDAAANKIISGWEDTGNLYLPETMEDAMWEAGAIYPAWMDQNTIYFKAIQTVYPDPKSILNGPYPVLAISLINRACAYAHRMMVGNSSLSNEQFAAEVDRIIQAECDTGRFANKVVVTPSTYFTTADVANGYSFHTDIALEGNVMKNVGTFTIIADRLDS